MKYLRTKNFLTEQSFYILLSFAAFLTDPAIVRAQSSEYNPTVFTQPLNLSRGKISPGSQNALVLSKDDYCRLTIQEWGWSNCDGIDAFILEQTPETDTTIVLSPNDEGHVSLDDWKSADLKEQIAAIEQNMKEGIQAESKKTGKNISFKAWRAYPTLNEKKKYLYYATDLDWDGDIVTNIKATVFDRGGYVEFRIVPINSNLNSAQIEKLIDDVLNLYKPDPGKDYTSFVNGDKVAAVGAVGVLATLLGVKIAKPAVAGLIALALLIAKKCAFLLLLPVVWIKRLFGRKKSVAPAVSTPESDTP